MDKRAYFSYLCISCIFVLSLYLLRPALNSACSLTLVPVLTEAPWGAISRGDGASEAVVLVKCQEMSKTSVPMGSFKGYHLGVSY